jgi:hypothetical protein
MIAPVELPPCLEQLEEFPEPICWEDLVIMSIVMPRNAAVIQLKTACGVWFFRSTGHTAAYEYVSRATRAGMKRRCRQTNQPQLACHSNAYTPLPPLSHWATHMHSARMRS